MSVYLYVSLPAYLKSQKPRVPNSRNLLRLSHGIDSVLLWRRCNTLRTSGSVNDVIFSHKITRWCLLLTVVFFWSRLNLLRWMLISAFSSKLLYSWQNDAHCHHSIERITRFVFNQNCASILYRVGDISSGLSTSLVNCLFVCGAVDRSDVIARDVIAPPLVVWRRSTANQQQLHLGRIRFDRIYRFRFTLNPDSDSLANRMCLDSWT